MKRTLLLLTCSILATDFAWADEITAASQVREVTLFGDRAEVTRSTKLNLAAGKHSIIFEGVPAQLFADSLRAAGSGTSNVIIEGVEFKTRYRKEDLSKQAEEIRRKIEQLQREIAFQNTSAERLNRQKSLLQTVALDQKIPEVVKDGVLRPRTSTEMSDVLKFVGDAESKIDLELRVVREKLADLGKDLELAQREQSNYQPTQRAESVVEVGLSAVQAGSINLDVTYQVNGASWSPAYNLNIKENDQYMVETYGVITQRTGEDWENVKLTLSTARPQIGLNRPVPYAQLIDIARPMPLPQSAGMALRGSVSFKDSRSDLAEYDELKKNLAFDAPAVKAKEEMALVEQNAEISKYGAISFKLPSIVSLKSDGSKEKVKVTEVTLKGEVLNVAVPALSQAVYREASVENSGETPLLPGPISVFDHGNFIGKQSIDYVPVNKKIKLPIGVSDDVVVTRKLVKKFEDDSGIVRSFRRISNQWEIEVENLGSKPANVVVLDSLPVSRNEQIKVSINSESPKRLKDDDESRLHKDNGIAEWHLSAKAKEKSVIGYETVVEFPTELAVTGVS